MTRAKESQNMYGISEVLVLFGLLLSLLISLSCGQNPAPLTPTSVVNESTLTVSPPKVIPAPASAVPDLPLFSLDWLAYYSDLVARVRLVDVELVYTQTEDVYFAEIEFEFEVLEYLKGGNGSERIWGIVDLPYAVGESAEKVRSKAVDYLNARETRWDDIDAIIFMRDSLPEVPSTHKSDVYYLGWFSGSGVGGYSLAASRLWLPLASGDEVKGVADEQHFLLDHPEVETFFNLSRQFGPAPDLDRPKDPLIPDGTTIGLSQLKELIAVGDAGLKQRIDATATANWQWMSEPQNLTAISAADSVTLSWNEARYPSEVIGYHVFRREDEESEFVLLAELQADAAEMTYRDTGGITPNSSYTYRVLSKSPKYGGGTADGGSAEIMVETPGAP